MSHTREWWIIDFRGKALLVNGFLVLALFVIPWIHWPYSGPNRVVSGQPHQVTSTPTVTPTAGPICTDLVVFQSDREPHPGNREIYRMLSSGTGVLRLTTNLTADESPDLSPDATLIAFATDRDGDWEIYRMNINGTDVFNLTQSPSADDKAPSWSGDLNRPEIAFQSNRSGNWEIYRMTGSGTTIIRLTDNPASDIAPDWSPDGAEIIFASDRDGNWEIYRMTRNGTAVTRLTEHDADDLAPTWSADGENIAFMSNRSGNWEVYTMTRSGTAVQRLTENPAWDVSPEWFCDNSHIIFQTNRDGNWEIYRMTSDGGLISRLSSNPGEDIIDDELALARTTPANTPTSPPTRTPTPTATNTSTTVPADTPTATVTIEPLPSPPAEEMYSLTARVFIDRLCDRHFEYRSDIPLSDVPVTLSFPNRASMTSRTTPFGIVNFSGFDGSGGGSVSVELPERYWGSRVSSCPDSPTNIPLDFGSMRNQYVEFRADYLDGPGTPPTPTATHILTPPVPPTAMPTRTPGPATVMPSPTPTITRTPTVTGTPTATRTPTPTTLIPNVTPTITLTPVVTGTPTATRTPTPTTTSGGVEINAWVSNPNPPQNSDVTVYGEFKVNGVGVSGVDMYTTWHYKTTTSYCGGVTDASGRASCTRNIGMAASGYTVRIDVRFTDEGVYYYTSTSFTPP